MCSATSQYNKAQQLNIKIKMKYDTSGVQRLIHIYNKHIHVYLHELKAKHRSLSPLSLTKTTHKEKLCDNINRNF